MSRERHVSLKPLPLSFPSIFSLRRRRFSRKLHFPTKRLHFPARSRRIRRRWEGDDELSPAVVADMSLSCTDCFSDLLCCEEVGSLDSGDGDECDSSPECFPADVEESIAGFVEGEGEYSPATGYAARFRSLSLDAASREEAVAWILKVRRRLRLLLTCARGRRAGGTRCPRAGNLGAR